MIKEFKQTFAIELTDVLQELVAIRIQPGSRPLHRCVEDCLILQDRWLIQAVYQRQDGQQGLAIIEKTMVFEAKCPWDKAFPKSVQIDYVKRPYCLLYKIVDRTVLILTLAVLVEFDLELLPAFKSHEVVDLIDLNRRIQNLEACLGIPASGYLHKL